MQQESGDDLNSNIDSIKNSTISWFFQNNIISCNLLKSKLIWSHLFDTFDTTKNGMFYDYILLDGINK